MESLDRAAAAIRAGGAVVYPTETVYGLGADALDALAVGRVFELKGRARTEPISMAVPDVETAFEYTDPTDRERAFAERFLPGPVTLVLARGERVPDVLTAGGKRVGVRVPDHERALSLLERVAPVTATSANLSGEPSARRVAEIDERLRERAATVVDDGETPGGGSTVVDVADDRLHRRGALADDIETWLDEH